VAVGLIGSFVTVSCHFIVSSIAVYCSFALFSPAFAVFLTYSSALKIESMCSSETSGAAFELLCVKTQVTELLIDLEIRISYIVVLGMEEVAWGCREC
jgi:hypothetical protein